jgi:hypothetical protein
VSGWSLVLSLPQSPTQPLLSLLFTVCALDIDNKIIIANVRLVGLQSEVLVMGLHSMHKLTYFIIFMLVGREESEIIIK